MESKNQNQELCLQHERELGELKATLGGMGKELKEIHDVLVRDGFADAITGLKSWRDEHEKTHDRDDKRRSKNLGTTITLVCLACAQLIQIALAMFR
jgi:hypothetical protein